MEKQYHAWDWHTLASFHATISNLEGYHHHLELYLDDTQRMAWGRFDEATTDEEIAIANADVDRVREIDDLIFELGTAIAKMHALEDLIEELGTPPTDDDNNAE